MLDFNGDGLVATDITHETVFVEGASDSMDPPFSFDTMSEFVIRFDDIFDSNNEHEYFRVYAYVKTFPFDYTTSTHNTCMRC